MPEHSMEEEEEKKKKKKNRNQHCCISHEFFRAATSNPNKIAVIHASGAAKIFRQHQNSGSSTAASVDDDLEKPSPSGSTAYDGDECFTFSQLLSAVDSLSSRLRCILDGGDDPYLIKSTGIIHREHWVRAQVSNSSMSLKPIEQSAETEVNSVHTPKIVGIYMVPSAEYIVSVLAILRCGEAFMPLDPFWPKERILSLVSSSGVDLIIGCSSSFGKQNHLHLDKSHWLVHYSSCPILCISLEGNLRDHIGPSQLSWPCHNEKQRSFCYLMYTSGSTGKPKGVCGTEQGLLNRFQWMQELYPLLGEEYLLFKTSISFIDHQQEFLASILTASTLVIPPFNELRDKLFYVLDFLQAYSINRLIAVPTLMRVILPSLQSLHYIRVRSSLKLLVLSGEVLPLSLWAKLSEILPETAILNLYGSTEVSGDCMYFDCKRLPMILKTETPSSVPIGIPLSNCDVVLVEENNAPSQGEIYVGGPCVSSGYFSDPSTSSLDFVKLPEGFLCKHLGNDYRSRYFLKTGDFARRLQSGDLVFLGRKDRTMKMGGQRIALEEIENTLRGYPEVADAVVVSRKGPEEVAFLEAFLVLKQKAESVEPLRSSIRNWLVDRLPLAMIPNQFCFKKSFPLSSTGKVDYAFLASSTLLTKQIQNSDSQCSDLLHVIKKAFCNGLAVDEVSDDDDFFMIGGNSLAAAHVSHILSIDMRLLYIFPSPSKLQMALLSKEGDHRVDAQIDANWAGKLEVGNENVHHLINSETPDLYSSKAGGKLLRTLHEEKDGSPVFSKCLKVDSYSYVSSEVASSRSGHSWSSESVSIACSYSRCNKVLYEGESVLGTLPVATWSEFVPKYAKGSMREVWKVHMESCVDASPIVVFRDREIYLYIGSHSHKFLCVNARSGFIQWEVKLEGRIECSAAILGDFSQVVVGCYKGKIYFIDSTNGKICWTFQTCGEVKSQPVLDKRRHLVWCGSYDHNLYALDYKNHCCIYKLPCGGSIYGSPALEEVHEKLYVASTNGRVTAVSVQALPFTILWQHELGVPVFGSLSISPSGSVICCLVDGHVVAFSSSGSIAWKCQISGPIFAGACISYVLPSQALVCCRNGSIYSFGLEKGDLLWEYNVGDSITASAYVDENFQLVSDPSHLPDRLICICGSSGKLYLLRMNLNTTGEANQPRKDMVQEFARLDLQGDIFSSPVMIGGRIFVGCRDDYVHCIAVEPQITVAN